MTWVIAIDGPGGAGKTTVSRALAHRFGIDHLDTGAYYRAATLAILRAGAPPGSADASAVVRRHQFDYREGRTLLDGEDVTEAIRSGEVTATVSEVSAVPDIRGVMVERQRRWVAKHGGRAVVEGRDIGTVVFPSARLKVFLTASVEVRAARRAAQQPELTDVALELHRRDELDSARAASLLSPAPDAVVVDTSEMSFGAVVEELMRLAQERGF